jgi:hypothetical protein
VRKLIVASLLLMLSSLAAAKEMGWVSVSRQNYRLEPGRWQAAGTYGPGHIQLNIGVRAASGVSLGLVRQKDLDQGIKSAMQCRAQGLVDSVFTCEYEAKDAMVLLIQDQRLPGDTVAAVLTGGWRRATQEAVSSNVITLSQLEWGCVRGCYPSYGWVNVSKEKFDLYPIAKTYGPITPDHDGNQVHVKMKAKQPMLLALLPVASADRLRANPAEAETILAGAPCKQRAVEKADLTCKLNLQDGTQQVVLMAEPGIPVKKKKVEVHITMVRCVANCSQE